MAISSLKQTDISPGSRSGSGIGDATFRTPIQPNSENWTWYSNAWNILGIRTKWEILSVEKISINSPYNVWIYIHMREHIFHDDSNKDKVQITHNRWTLGSLYETSPDTQEAQL